MSDIAPPAQPTGPSPLPVPLTSFVGRDRELLPWLGFCAAVRYGC